MTLKDTLQSLIKGEILDDPESLQQFRKDASIFAIQPSFVIFPEDSEDIKRLIDFINAHKNLNLNLTPRSAGTDMSGGAVNDSIILDLTQGFSHVKEIGEENATVEPGVFYRDFEKETLKKDLILPCYPASREICTVGGMVANNSAGEKTLLFGQTKDFVSRLKVILSDGNEYIFEALNKEQLDKKLQLKSFEGEIHRKVFKLINSNYDLIQKSKPKVSKNSTGYLLWDVWNKEIFDMTKLFVGSQGTLGIITEIKFRLIHPKKYSRMLVIFLKDLSNLGEITNQVLEYKPETFESYDDYTIKFAMKFLPEIIKVFKPTNLISLFFQFIPEIWMSITGGVPKLILIAEFRGDSQEEVDSLCNQAKSSLKNFDLKMRVTKNEEESRKYWTVRRESFNLLRKHSQNLRTAPFIDDIIVTPEKLSNFLPKLRSILSQYNLTYTIAGHIGNGNFHIIPLMDFSNPKTKEIISELGERVYDLVFDYDGSMSAEHNDGIVRGVYLEKMYGKEMFKIFKEVKKIFDPNNILNPHKKTDATNKFFKEHLSPN